MRQRLDDRLKDAIAFEATVVSSKSFDGSRVSVLLEVNLAWTAVLDSHVEVITERDTTRCGLAEFFTVGRECLVYAHPQDGRLFTDSCLGTADINSSDAQLEIAELERRASMASG